MAPNRHCKRAQAIANNMSNVARRMAKFLPREEIPQAKPTYAAVAQAAVTQPIRHRNFNTLQPEAVQWSGVATTVDDWVHGPRPRGEWQTAGSTFRWIQDNVEADGTPAIEWIQKWIDETRAAMDLPNNYPV